MLHIAPNQATLDEVEVKLKHSQVVWKKLSFALHKS